MRILKRAEHLLTRFFVIQVRLLRFVGTKRQGPIVVFITNAHQVRNAVLLSNQRWGIITSRIFCVTR